MGEKNSFSEGKCGNMHRPGPSFPVIDVEEAKTENSSYPRLTFG